VKPRAYGQYCGFARALELIGERWAMLIVRDLLVGPKRFTDLVRGLPGIPSNVLTTRLKALEAGGVIQRRLQPPPSRGVAYEMTPYGAELETVVVALGKWGAKTLGDPRPDETVTQDSLITALRTTFQPDAARAMHATFALRVGPLALHARVDDGHVTVAGGAPEDADVTIEAGPGIRALMAGEISPTDAIARGVAQITGNKKLFARFSEIFRIDPLPPDSN
jgi:DNA-binding HxlR family transcriptional regulator